MGCASSFLTRQSQQAAAAELSSISRNIGENQQPEEGGQPAQPPPPVPARETVMYRDASTDSDKSKSIPENYYHDVKGNEGEVKDASHLNSVFLISGPSEKIQKDMHDEKKHRELDARTQEIEAEHIKNLKMIGIYSDNYEEDDDTNKPSTSKK